MNNRQSGRRRGRNNNSNNNRSQSGGRGGVDQANRIDSRARGNAVQMIEKYKNLARDAQLAGDRVQTEYYLQFADHYFRVHSDFRARQEERQSHGGQPDRSHDRHREVRGVEDFDGHDETDGDSDTDDRSGNEAPRGRDDDGDRDFGRGNRNRPRDRRERDDTGRAAADPGDHGDAETVAEEAAAPKPRRGRRPRDTDAGSDVGGIDSAVLPPAIGRSAESEAAGEAPAPKARRPRRTLAARAEGVEAAE